MLTRSETNWLSGWTSTRGTQVAIPPFTKRLRAVKLLIEKGASVAVQDPQTQGTLLHEAAESGHADVVRFLIDAGLEIDAADKGGQTAVERAVARNCREVVAALVAAGAEVTVPVAVYLDDMARLRQAIAKGHDVDKRLATKETALHLAAEHGNGAMAAALLDNGADVNALVWREDGRTPLYVAILEGHFDVITLLLDRGARIDACGENGWTVFHLAAGRGQESVVRLFLEHGADIEVFDERGWTPLCAAVRWEKPEIVTLLLKVGAEVNLEGADEWAQPLSLAVERNNEALVRILLDQGADVGAAAPLCWAAGWGNLVMLQTLLDRGADIKARADSAETPLCVALQNQDVATAEFLLRAGADVNVVGPFGWTPLQIALWPWESSDRRGEIDAYRPRYIHINRHKIHPVILTDPRWRRLVTLLVEAGADVDVCNSLRDTPLHLAVAQDAEEIASLLLFHGAKASARNHRGTPPLHHAAAKGNLRLVECLLDARADIDAQDDDGDTPLHGAALRGRTAVVELLLERGADAGIKDVDGHTPCDEAARGGHRELAKLLWRPRNDR